MPSTRSRSSGSELELIAAARAPRLKRKSTHNLRITLGMGKEYRYAKLINDPRSVMMIAATETATLPRRN